MKAVRYKVQGLKKLQRQLRTTADLTARKLRRTAVAEGCKLVRDTARLGVPVRSGSLLKAMSYSVKTARSNRFVIVGKVGAKRGYRVVSGNTYKLVAPSRYLHLVDHGFKHYRGRKVEGKWFLERAARIHRTDVKTLIGRAVALAVKEGLRR